MKKKRTLSGTVSISRWRSNAKPYEGISITVRDELSRCEVLRVELTPLDFGDAITGLSDRPCSFEWGPSPYIGMKAEHKIVFIPAPKGEFVSLRGDESAQTELLKPFEVDGWSGRGSDLANMHNWDSKRNGWNVSFNRWVPA